MRVIKPASAFGPQEETVGNAKNTSAAINDHYFSQLDRSEQEQTHLDAVVSTHLTQEQNEAMILLRKAGLLSAVPSSVEDSSKPGYIIPLSNQSSVYHDKQEKEPPVEIKQSIGSMILGGFRKIKRLLTGNHQLSPSPAHRASLGFEQFELRELPSTSSLLPALTADYSPAQIATMNEANVSKAAASIDKASWGALESGLDPSAIGVLHPHPGGYMAIPSLSPDGSKIVTGGTSDRLVRVWDAQIGKQLLELSGHTGPVKDTAVSPDGKTIASVAHDQTARLWDLQTGALLKTFALGGQGDGVQFSPDGKTLGVNAYGQGIVAIDIATGNQRALPKQGGDDPEQFSFTPDSKNIIYSAGNANTVHYSLVENRTLFQVNNGVTGRRIAVAPDGSMFATGTDNGLINIWNATTGQKIGTLNAQIGDNTHVTSVAFSHDMSVLLSASYGGKVFEWDIASIKQGIFPSQPTKTFNLIGNAGSITFSPTDGTFFASSSPSGTLSRLMLVRRKAEPTTTSSTSGTTQSTTTTSTSSTSTETVTAKEVMGAPTMYAHVEHDGSGGFRLFLRFRAPVDRTSFAIAKGFSVNSNAAGIDAEHLGGTKDMTVMIECRNGLEESGIYPIRMLDGQTRQVLQTVYGQWNQSTHRFEIITQQDSFEVQTAKKVESAQGPIAPGMQVETEGRIVYVRLQTPSDHSIVDIANPLSFESLGRGSQQEFAHSGGTREGLVQLAIPANAPVNQDLKVRLWDRQYGNILKDIVVRYDGTNVQVVSGQTQLADSIPHTQVIQNVLATNTQIRSIQAAGLYQNSAYYVDSSELEPRLAKAFPDVFPADIGKAAEQMHVAGPTYSVGFYQDQILKKQADYRNIYSAAMNTFAATMGNLLTASVDFWFRVRAGETERPLYDALVNKVNTANFGAVDPLGIVKPNFGQILEAGRNLCAQQRDMIIRTVMDDIALKQITPTTTTTSSSTPTTSPEAHARIMRTILESVGGIGTPIERIAGYVQTHPDAANVIPTSVQPQVLAMMNSLQKEALVAKGTSTYDVAVGGVSVTESRGVLQPQSLRWTGTVDKGNMRRYTFSVQEHMILKGILQVGDAQEAVMVLKNGQGQAVMTIGAGNVTAQHKGTFHQTLPSGSYTLEVLGTEKFDKPISYALEADLSKTNLASIVGTVERGGKQFEVMMSRIVLNSLGQTESEITKIPSIDPAKPTWIVIHGRKDFPESTAINELVKNLLVSLPKDQQVITLDWRGPADDNLPTILKGASWINMVSNWASIELKQLSIPSYNINFVGHSWGTFLSYETAVRLGGVGGIVALDPAKDLPVVNDYSTAQVNFASISQKSMALHSSFLGSASLANSADYSLNIVDRVIGNGPIVEHGLAVTAFASLLRDQGQVGAFFRPLQLQGVSTKTTTSNADFLSIRKSEGYDATLRIHSIMTSQPDASGQMSTVFKAIPDILEYTDINGNQHADRTVAYSQITQG